VIRNPWCILAGNLNEHPTIIIIHSNLFRYVIKNQMRYIVETCGSLIFLFDFIMFSLISKRMNIYTFSKLYLIFNFHGLTDVETST
jgi:hypothetical protein